MERKAKTRAIAALVVAWVVLAGIAVVTVVGSQESDLASRAEAALAEAGVDDVEVVFEGRDALVFGTGSLDETGTIAILASLEGVRRVDLLRASAAGSSDGGAPTDGPAPPPPTTASPSTTTTTTAAPPSTTTTTVPAVTVAGLTASLLDGALTITGTVPDAESAARVAAVADLIYAPFVTNELVVDPDIATASWVPGAAGAIAVLPITGDAAVEVSGEQAVLTGSTGSPQKRALIEGALRAALGPAVQLDSRVEVTGLRPPRFEGRAPGDGTLILGGEMPDQAAVDRIYGAAAQVYGADLVDNRLTIDTGVESTFSLFRVPLIFSPLQPVPEWEVIIRNDVISGGLRGGATFASGSAELTPELQRLAGIAAGIMTRNPTIAMTIEGHTDSIGPDAYNQGLSVARAEAATAFIAGLGVDPSRLTAVGYGETRPIADNGTSAGRAQNRRIEFVMGPAGPEGDQ